jgi:hypothetical protein
MMAGTAGLSTCAEADRAPKRNSATTMIVMALRKFDPVRKIG